MIVVIECCNICIILSSQKPLDIIANFIVLAILADFDTMIYNSTGNQYLKKLFYEEIRDDLLIVQHTTSKNC